MIKSDTAPLVVMVIAQFAIKKAKEKIEAFYVLMITMMLMMMMRKFNFPIPMTPFFLCKLMKNENWNEIFIPLMLILSLLCWLHKNEGIKKIEKVLSIWEWVGHRIGKKLHTKKIFIVIRICESSRPQLVSRENY